LTNDLDIVGQIALAMQISTLAVIGMQGLLSAALPVLSRASAKSDPRLAHYPLVVACTVIAVFGMAMPAAFLVGPTVVSATIGPSFAPAGELLAPALLVGGLSVLPSGFVQILVTQGRLWPGLISGWLAVLTLLVVLPISVHTAGALGAIIASALAWSVRALIVIIWALRVNNKRSR
jgi:O-antigen/teichoic acid export membrane protein